MMVYLMELAAGNAIARFLSDGWISVGTEVHVKHLAATPVGQTVRAVATVIQIVDRSAVFSVTFRSSSADYQNVPQARSV